MGRWSDIFIIYAIFESFTRNNFIRKAIGQKNIIDGLICNVSPTVGNKSQEAHCN